MPFGGLGIWEVLLILLVILVVFGPRRLPELGGAIGKGIREFKRSFRDIETELREPLDDDRRELKAPPEDPRPPRAARADDTAPADPPKQES